MRFFVWQSNILALGLTFVIAGRLLTHLSQFNDQVNDTKTFHLVDKND